MADSDGLCSHSLIKALQAMPKRGCAGCSYHWLQTASAKESMGSVPDSFHQSSSIQQVLTLFSFVGETAGSSGVQFWLSCCCGLLCWAAIIWVTKALVSPAVCYKGNYKEEKWDLPPVPQSPVWGSTTAPSLKMVFCPSIWLLPEGFMSDKDKGLKLSEKTGTQENDKIFQLKKWNWKSAFHSLLLRSKKKLLSLP